MLFIELLDNVEYVADRKISAQNARMSTSVLALEVIFIMAFFLICRSI